MSEFNDDGVVFLILKPEEITNFIINISTSRNKECFPVLPNGRIIVEIKSKYEDKVLEYKWYSKEEVIQLREASPSWLDQLFSLFT